jgi:hypothetical protein
MPTAKPVQLSLPEGEALRDFNLALLERKYPRLIDRLRAVAVRFCEIRARNHGGGWVTASDVRSIVPIPEGMSPNVMGRVFRCGLFRFVDWQPSRQPRRHGNREGIWTLRNGATG